MPSLREMQRAFARALVDGDAGAISPLVIADGIEPGARLRIYRNNHRENSLSALRASYPVIERLVGEAYFRQSGLEYLARYPSRSGNLDALGDRFAHYLAESFGEGEYRYLADVARLEWCCQEIMAAPDHAGLDLAALRQVPAEGYSALVFQLHPAARLLDSRFPVLRIWQANQAEADASERIELGEAQRVLLTRATRAVEFRLLDAAELEFLSGIGRGETFETCTALAMARGTFDPAAALRRFVGANVIVDFSRGSPDRA
jgi:hypothetical protein